MQSQEAERPLKTPELPHHLFASESLVKTRASETHSNRTVSTS